MELFFCNKGISIIFLQTPPAREVEGPAVRFLPLEKREGLNALSS